MERIRRNYLSQGKAIVGAVLISDPGLFWCQSTCEDSVMSGDKSKNNGGVGSSLGPDEIKKLKQNLDSNARRAAAALQIESLNAIDGVGEQHSKKSFIDYLYVIGRDLAKLGVARRGGYQDKAKKKNPKKINFENAYPENKKALVPLQITDIYGFKAFVRAWEDRLMGAFRYRKSVQDKPVKDITFVKDKRAKSLAGLDRKTRRFIRRGIDYFKTRAVLAEPNPPQQLQNNNVQVFQDDTARSGYKNLKNTEKLDAHFTASIQSFTTPLQKKMSKLGYFFAIVFAFGCAFTTGSAMYVTLPLFFTFTPFVLSFLSIAVAISTFYVNYSIGKNLTDVFKSIFADKGWFYGLTHYQDEYGKWHRYNKATLKLVISFIVSLAVGTTTASVFFFFFINAPVNFAFLAPYAFLCPPVAIITGIAALFTMTAVMMKINQGLFAGNFWPRIKEYAQSILSSDKPENIGKYTAQKVVQGVVTGLVMAAYIPLVAIGLIATAWVGCGSLATNILPHLFTASVTVYSYTAYFVSMFLAVLGQTPFVMVTAVKTVVLLSDLFVTAFFLAGEGIKNLFQRLSGSNVVYVSDEVPLIKLNNKNNQQNPQHAKPIIGQESAFGRFKGFIKLLWDRVTSSVNAVGNAFLVHPALHKTINPITNEPLGPVSRIIAVIGAGLTSLAAFAAGIKRGIETDEHLAHTARVMQGVQNLGKRLGQADDNFNLEPEHFKTLTGDKIEPKSDNAQTDYVFIGEQVSAPVNVSQ